jgi:hypothetical protein
MRLWQTCLCIHGLQGFEIKGRAINGGRKKNETARWNPD